MRILHLGNSNDVNPLVPEGERAHDVAERTITGLTGEAVETIARVIWPAAELPGIVAGWLERYEPDVVFLRMSSYWVTYESVPLRVERRGGIVGRALARAGFKAGGNATVASSSPFRFGRRMAARNVGGDTFFTPAEAAGHVSDVLRRVLARESVVVAVRGPLHIFNSSGTPEGRERSRRRLFEFDALVAEACRNLHVPYASVAGTATPDLLLPDEVHENAKGARIFGELEGRAVAEAWLAARR
ncbi:MAG: SGNH/GDSL hydrolase family protein [Chloroflexi bacterium]|nr:SGNH/GDSL hydrolase family protein [Chloroflexota bacterium]